MKKFVFALSILFLYSCSSTAPDNSSTNGNFGTCGVINGSFVGDWFDYYKRAITWMDCENWIEAEKDFRKALSVRDEEKRRVYTLGMHFLNNYFPNRELGITLYNQQRYDEAIDSLLKSYRQFPSEKARQYLILATRLSNVYQSKERSNPTISLTKQTPNAFVVDLADDVLIDKVAVNNESFLLKDELVIDGITVTYVPLVSNFTISLDKSKYEGQNINIIVTDVFGKTSNYSISATIDKTPPNISLISRTSSGSNLTWTFEVSDNKSIISEVLVNNIPVSINNGEFKWESEKTNLNITVQDDSGNIGSYVFNSQLAKTLFVEAEIASKSTQEPNTLISLYMGTDNALKTLVVNNKSYPLTGKQEALFNILQPLELGENLINIEVQDAQGSQFTSVTIAREAPLVNRPNERLKLAVYPFDCAGKANSQACLKEGQAFTPFFDAINKRRRFDLLSRDNLSQRIQELKLCEFDFSEKCKWEATQLLGSQAMLSVEVTRRKQGNVSDLELYAKVIDAKSGEILITFDSYQQLTGQSELDTRYLANKVLTYFPLVSFTPDGGVLAIDRTDFKPWVKMPVFATKDNSVTFRGKLEKAGQNVTLPSNTLKSIDKVYSL